MPRLTTRKPKRIEAIAEHASGDKRFKILQTFMKRHQFHADAACFRAWCQRRGHYFCRLSDVRELMRPVPLPTDPPAWGLCDGNRAGQDVPGVHRYGAR